MQSFRAVQLDMLAELDRICRENGIPYILSRHTARSALMNHTLPDRISVPTIAMRYSDALRLRQLTPSKSRRWESALENRGIPRPVFRYSDEDTLMVRMDEASCFRNHGLAVEVELIRSTPANHILHRLLVVMEAACAMACTIRHQSRWLGALLKLVTPLERLGLRLAYNGLGKPSGRLRIARFPKKNVEFAPDMLDKRQEIEMEGRMFFVPAALEKYMLTEYDEKWRRRNMTKPDEDFHMTVMDAFVPAEAAKTILQEISCEGPKVNWLSQCLLMWRMRRLRQKIEGYWALLFFTKERFDLYRQLMPRKQEILEKHSAGDLAGVRQLLKPYFAAIDKYYPKQLVMCFDPDILDVALDVLRRDGKAAYADRLRAGVRPEHIKPMKIEGINHE